MIIDAHEDIAWTGLALGRDVSRSAWETRRQEKGGPTPRRNGLCTLGLPEWIAGDVAVVFGTIFVAPAKHEPGSVKRQVYANKEEAYRLGLEQVDWYHRLAEREQQIDLVTDSADLERVLASQGTAEPHVGIVMLMEGADPIRSPAEVEEWYQRGVRLVGLSWAAGTRYAGGNNAPGPLSDAGRDLLAAMSEVGMALDTSHLSAESFWEALDRYEGPVIASHSNPQALVPGPRHITDRMIAALVERDGVIGTAMFNRFLKPNWIPGSDAKEAVTLDDVAAVIDHVCQVAGDAAHVGLGSDLDGGFGAESAPAGIETVADLGRVAAPLAARGYSTAEIEAILGGNWLRVLRGWLND